MLKHIPKVLSPELVKYMMEMGHGDTLVIADGNFPASTLGQRIVRADGIGVPELLAAILTLMPLDVQYSQYPIGLMSVVEGDPTVPTIWQAYESILTDFQVKTSSIAYFERFKFYETAKKAYVIVATGETALYANIILTKGVL